MGAFERRTALRTYENVFDFDGRDFKRYGSLIRI